MIIIYLSSLASNDDVAVLRINFSVTTEYKSILELGEAIWMLDYNFHGMSW